LVDEVIWVAGGWCDQFDEGHYPLMVGESNNRLKIAIDFERIGSMTNDAL